MLHLDGKQDESWNQKYACLPRQDGERRQQARSRCVHQRTRVERQRGAGARKHAGHSDIGYVRAEQPVAERTGKQKCAGERCCRLCRSLVCQVCKTYPDGAANGIHCLKHYDCPAGVATELESTIDCVTNHPVEKVILVKKLSGLDGKGLNHSVCVVLRCEKGKVQGQPGQSNQNHLEPCLLHHGKRYFKLSESCIA